MSKFNSIEISKIVALHPKVETRKIFGLFQRTSYQPTHSQIESFQNYYNASAANEFTQIAESASPEESINQMKGQNTTDNGDYRMDLCISHDCCFAAFQIFARKGQQFEPFSQLCFLEGDTAKAFESLIL